MKFWVRRWITQMEMLSSVCLEGQKVNVIGPGSVGNDINVVALRQDQVAWS